MVLINSAGCHGLAPLICINLKWRRGQRNWIQRSQLCLLSHHHHDPFLFSAGVFLLLYQLHTFFSSSSLSSHQELWGKKNLFKHNSCLEGRTSIPGVSFWNWNPLGVFWTDRFEAPACILCWTDVPINPWWSGTSPPTSEQSPQGPPRCHWLSQMLSLAAPLQVGFSWQIRTPQFWHFGCLSEQDGHWAPVGSAVRTESVLLTSGGIEKYPHIIPWQRDREGRCRCSVGLEGEGLEGPSQSNHCRILEPCDAVKTKIKVSSFCTLHRHSGTSVLWQNLSLEILSLKLVSCVE